MAYSLQKHKVEDRISGLESFAQMSVTLTRITNEHRNVMDESLRQAEAGQRQRDELPQQLLQAVAVMQADIVRIDERHS